MLAKEKEGAKVLMKKRKVHIDTHIICLINHKLCKNVAFISNLQYYACPIPSPNFIIIIIILIIRSCVIVIGPMKQLDLKCTDHLRSISTVLENILITS